MHILLINANPVVSRLLLLCTRDDAVVLDEITSAADVQRDMYEAVFVDEASYDRGVADLLVKLGLVKKIFISYRSDSMKGFDMTIKKPFLPSQITDIIKNIEVVDIQIPIEDEISLTQVDAIEAAIPFSVEDNVPNNEEEVERDASEESSAPAVLDSDEIEKIKALLDMDDDLGEIEEVLSEEEIEARKVELIKEQLIAEGLEIVEENEIVEELSIDLDGTLTQYSDLEKKKSKSKKSKEKKSKEKKKKSKSKKIKFTEENMERIEDAVEMAMATMTKKQMKQLLKGKEIEISVQLEGND